MTHINNIIKKITPLLFITLLLICISTVSAQDNTLDTHEKKITSNTHDNTTLTSNTKNKQIHTVYVSKKGNDSNKGTKNSPKRTIKEAIKSVKSGGTIHITPGKYYESGITINKNINIIGENTKTTIINSHNKQAIKITAKANLKLFTIQQAKTNGSGGAIHNKGILKLENMTITTSTAKLRGGAIYNEGQLSITNSTLRQNNATNGGAIYNTKGALLKNCLFTKNNAMTNGGAIYNTAKLSIKNNTFHNNKATNGGSIYSKTVNPIKINITYSQFTHNTAKTGGAIYAYNHTILNIKYSTFKSNNQSAIYIKTDQAGNNIYNSTFTKNSATYGGAIRNAHTNTSIKKNTFHENSATYGSTLHNFKGNIILNYNILTDNNKDIYNKGNINADYNWWGKNNIKLSRIINTKVNKWLYLRIQHKYRYLMNSSINTTISVYNIFDGKEITPISRSTNIPDYHMKIIMKKDGKIKNYNSNSGYCKLTNKFNKEGNVNFIVKAPHTITSNTLNIHATETAHLFMKSLQKNNADTATLEINVTDNLNNTIRDGSLKIYLNNKKIQTVNASCKKIKISKHDIGVYDLKVVFGAPNYHSVSKNVKLTVNPKSDYTMRIVNNPALFTEKRGTLRTIIRNNNKQTVNTGLVKFYLNDKHVGTSEVKNNLSTLKINMPPKEGNYSVKMKYYLNNKFIIACADIFTVNKPEAQIKQETFITLAGDLISNSKITSNKKDVYFAMDRTTASYNYSPNDMKIMNNIAYNLRSNGFNVKTVKNGPGETYETARYMYKNNVRNSICFVLCNGVDANVIREYLKGYDNLLTTVRNRGNDIVLGWFHGAGDIYNPDGEYYYWLEKAWDDNYSRWGGISNPRKTMEKDGIKIVFERYDMKGDSVAQSFIQLYGGKITHDIPKNSTICLKTNIYNINNQNMRGNIVYTLNDKLIKNVSVEGKEYTFKYTMPNNEGTSNIKATYYFNNKMLCSTNRYVKVQ